MSAAISARTAPNAKTSGFCHEQKKEQEQLSASHPSPLMTELEVIKKERSRDRLGCTKSSSLVHFDRTLAGRVVEVVRGHRGPPPKSLDSDENFKPEHTLSCRELRIVAIYALFGYLWAKKVPFWVKNSVS